MTTVRTKSGRNALVRGVALTAFAFWCVAESHEALHLLGHAHSHTRHDQSPGSAPSDSNDSCAFCVLVGSTAVATPFSTLPIPRLTTASMAPLPPDEPIWVESAWSPVSRRGPPSSLHA